MSREATRFTKMHGLGNDFVLIECVEGSLPNPSILAKRLCHRRFGIGADQILLAYPSDIADFRMAIFNADGSEVEMCGNGIRCLAKYIWDRGYSVKKVIEIETLAGIIRPERIGDLIRVDMGEPVFEPERIPILLEGAREQVQRVIDYPLLVDKTQFMITCLSMGNPHAVIVVDKVSSFPVAYYGPLLENHRVFPKRTNVEFIEVLNRKEIRMRVWERGSGETMACGSGAAAVAVASHVKGLTNRSVTVHLEGGDLTIEWADNNRIFMTGPAVEVFWGEINLTSFTETFFASAE
jgi:diaminopimelate epimerase